MALDKTIEEISEADLTSLIDAGTPELKTLDYKQSLPGNSDEDRKEFLADASSFANAAGSHLIYGMRAEAGVPTELLGVPDDGDAAILRLESSIRDGIVPRITGVHSTAIKLGNSKTAVLVRVPRAFRLRTWSDSRTRHGFTPVAPMENTSWMLMRFGRLSLAPRRRRNAYGILG